MRFLSPSVRAQPDPRVFGVMTGYLHRGIPAWIADGTKPWAADNGSFTHGWKPDKFFPWLETLRPYRDTCLFITAPDIVGNARATLHLWRQWATDPRFIGWPLAFVAQDGQQRLDFPDPAGWTTLFVGGTTRWKLSDGALQCIKRAQSLNKRIHIGRVNWKTRYLHFAMLQGSDAFTCDGTRPRFVGYESAITAWHELENTHVLHII